MNNNFICFGIDLSNILPHISIIKCEETYVVPSVPSYIAYNNGDVINSNSERNITQRITKIAINEVLQLIGIGYSEIRRHLNKFKCTVISYNDIPVIEIKEKYGVKYITPQRVLVDVFKKFAEFACNKAELPLHVSKYAVITAPDYFDNRQRKATIEAGKLAGIHILEIINETAAISLAYRHECVGKGATKNILIYNFGRSSLKVSIVEVKENGVSIKASRGDSRLGGEDIDYNLTEYYVNELKKKGCDISKNKNKINKLKQFCEKAKILLSGNINEIYVDYELLEECNVNSYLTTAKMDDINSELYNQAFKVMKNALDKSGLPKTQIDDIILIGGSSRIKAIRERIKSFFCHDDFYIWKSHSSDEAAAIGAALNAKAMCKYKNEYKSRGGKVLVEGELSHSIGIEGNNGEMIIILQKGTIYGDAIVKEGFTPLNDYDMLMRWNIYEGESEKAKECNLLFSYVMNNLPPIPKNDYNFEVKMCVNGNNMLDVEITEKHKIVSGVNFVLKIK